MRCPRRARSAWCAVEDELVGEDDDDESDLASWARRDAALLREGAMLGRCSSDRARRSSRALSSMRAQGPGRRAVDDCPRLGSSSLPSRLLAYSSSFLRSRFARSLLLRGPELHKGGETTAGTTRAKKETGRGGRARGGYRAGEGASTSRTVRAEEGGQRSFTRAKIGERGSAEPAQARRRRKRERTLRFSFLPKSFSRSSGSICSSRMRRRSSSVLVTVMREP